jgi:peroxiredoxin
MALLKIKLVASLSARHLLPVGALLLVAIAGLPALAATPPPAAGGNLPDFSLAVPETGAHRAYLGIEDGETFRIPEIDAEIVIIEIFSMYCPHCQREAPTVNRLYERIQADPKLRARIRIIGIGVGNSAFEVNHFRQTYAIPFPLFADGDFAIHKLLGEVRTPFFIGIRNHEDGGHEIFYAQLGGPRDAGAMLEELLQQAGLTE